MPRASRPIIVTLGDLQKIDESLTDPRPSAPAHDVFRRLRKHHADRTKAAQNAEPGRRKIRKKKQQPAPSLQRRLKQG